MYYNATLFLSMLSIIKSMSLQGLCGYLVDVQVDISPGLPSFDVVGLPDVSIRESKERVRTAIKNSGFNFFSRKIVVNLAPATKRKEGALYDLPIAVGILSASDYIKKGDLSDIVFIGELSLDGKVNRVNGILPMCIELAKLGIKKVVLPKENEVEASVVKGISVIPVSSLKETVMYLNGEATIDCCKFGSNKFYQFVNEKNEENKINYIDFSDIKGQKNVKRAVEVAASGGHNLLMIGTPGSGKTMIAQRIPTILPDLSFDECLEITKIHSIAGELSEDVPVIMKRPFRAPHHTISTVSLVGGGRYPKPGEISLSHYGVLFLDELPEFKRTTLEVLREPIEDGRITIGRASQVLTFPSRFMLVASMNPCPCGFYGSEKECKCSREGIKKYLNKISGPLLDRIDIQVEVSSVKFDELDLSEEVEDSFSIRERVNRARKIQLERYKDLKIFSNSELTPKLIEEFCNIDLEEKKLLKNAFNKLNLSARACSRILKVARTIADMHESKNIEIMHLLEALQYRGLEKKYDQL